MSVTNYLSVTNRNEIEIKGVVDIISYDSNKIVIQLAETELTICGENFNVKKLDVENKSAMVSGHVDSLVYSSHSEKNTKSFLTSLFR